MLAENYKAKIVQHIKKIDYNERLNIARKYNYNLHKAPSEFFILDFYNCPNALSEEQYSALFRGDESYAGSENFINILNNVKEIFKRNFVVPVHNLRGTEHLILKVFENDFISNNPTDTFKVLCSYFNRKILGNGSGIYYFTIEREFEKFLELKRMKGFKILNASNIFSQIVFWKIEGKLSGNLKDLVYEMTKDFDIIILSADADLMAHVGALIILNDENYYRQISEWLVSFEGLHTYGGLSGRDMELIAVSLNQVLDENYWHYRYYEIKNLYDNVRSLGYDVEGFNSDGFFIHVENGIGFNLALFLSGQIRAKAYEDKLFLRIPKRVYFREHYDYFLKVLSYLKNRNYPKLKKCFETKFYEIEIMDYELLEPLEKYEVIDYDGFNYRLKGVEIIFNKSKEERIETIEEAGYNTFLLKSEDVYIDLLTDSGTSSQSDEQIFEGLKYDGKNAFDVLKESVYEIFGFDKFIITHQGRQAEHFISQHLIKKGQYVLNNMYFTTTRFHQEYAGGIFVDLIVKEAHIPQSLYPFKGDFDIEAVESFIKEKGPENIAYICIETNVNMAGGQPISMKNIKKLREIADYYKIPIVFDATRIAENAYFIKQREEGYENKTIKEIVREILSYGDFATISAKKDPLTNISGLLLIRDDKIYRKIYEFATAFDGDPYNGGLADRDLVMLAIGLKEMVDYDYLRSRIKQVEYLGNKLIENKIPLVLPIGGHAIYLDAKKFLEHLDQDYYPAQALSAEIFIEGGVRTMERGTVSAGRDPITGKNRKPSLELVRITIPRRVYSNSQMDHVVETIVNVYNRRFEIKGLEFVYEPPFLRFFTAKFKKRS
jgi:tyrosine phenol-lyase